jgi:hypothetical protein
MRAPVEKGGTNLQQGVGGRLAANRCGPPQTTRMKCMSAIHRVTSSSSSGEIYQVNQKRKERSRRRRPRRPRHIAFMYIFYFGSTTNSGSASAPSLSACFGFFSFHFQPMYHSSGLTAEAAAWSFESCCCCCCNKSPMRAWLRLAIRSSARSCSHLVIFCQLVMRLCGWM